MSKKFYTSLAAASLLISGVAAGYAVSASQPSDSPASYEASVNEDTLTPLECTIATEFTTDPATGKNIIRISVTPPTEGRDASYNRYPLTKLNQVRLFRTTDPDLEGTLLKQWRNAVPGEMLTIDDDADVLELGSTYHYYVYAVRSGNEGTRTYSEVTFGISPVTPETPVAESTDGFAPVNVKYVCPEKNSGDYWSPVPFPAGLEYSEIRLYKYDETGQEVTLRSDANPKPGDEFTYVDNDVKDGSNTYYVRTYTDLGNSSPARASVFIGYDYPSRVMNVEAMEVEDGKVKVRWSAPEGGFNGGKLNPATLRYILYRADNDYGQDKKVLADALVDCEFIDDLAGVEEETMMYYRVQPYCDIEAPEGTYNYGETTDGILVGPAKSLPFSESFNAGHKFNKAFDNKWSESFGYTFANHYLRNNVSLEMAEGVNVDLKAGVDGGTDADDLGPDAFFYVSCSSWSTSTESGYLTSGSIDFSEAQKPILSFYYIPFTGHTGVMAVEAYTGALDENGDPIFEEILTHSFAAEGEETVTKPEWTKTSFPLDVLAGKSRVRLRLRFQYPDETTGRLPMLIDSFVVEDYPAVSDLSLEQDNNKFNLSWNLPATAGEKEVSYNVFLNDELLANTSDKEYTYEGIEQGDSYQFGIQALYADGVDSEIVKTEEIYIRILDFKVGDFYFIVQDDVETMEPTDNVELNSYEGEGGDIVIPAIVEYKGKRFNVTDCNYSLFRSMRSVKSVKIEAEISEIPANFFYGCTNLESVSLPSTIGEIGEKAFFGCVSLPAVALPDGLVSIGEGAFEQCRLLTEIVFGDSLEEIGAKAFSKAAGLAKVTFATPEPPVVGEGAFADIASPCEGICPEGSEEAYAAVAQLAPITFKTSGSVFTIGIGSDVNVEYFDTTGRRIAAPVKGEPTIMRIRSNDGTVKSVKIIKK